MPRTLPLYAGLLAAILAGAGLWAWSATRAPAASTPPAAAPSRPDAVGAFFERDDGQAKGKDPRKDDCGGCGGKKEEPKDQAKRAPIMPLDDALFIITGRGGDHMAPTSTAGSLDLAVDGALEGRFIYWCGAPVGKVEGRWRLAEGTLAVTRVDADKDVAIVDLPASDGVTPRRARCEQAHARLGRLLGGLPARLTAGDAVGAYRVSACGGGRAVLVAREPGGRRFDDWQVCVDAAGRPVQLDLTRAAATDGGLDAEHLICFVDAAAEGNAP